MNLTEKNLGDVFFFFFLESIIKGKVMFSRGSGMVAETFTDLLIMVLQNHVDGSGLPFKQAPLFSRVMNYSERRARSLTMCEVNLSPGSYTVACFSFGKLMEGKYFCLLCDRNSKV